MEGSGRRPSERGSFDFVTRAVLSQLPTGSAFAIVGVAVAYGGFLALLAAAIVGLFTIFSIWLAAVVVGLVAVIAGYVCFEVGRSKIKSMEKDDIGDRILDEVVRRAEAMLVSNGEKIREVGASIGEAVKKNPIAFSLIGMGLGWFLVRGLSLTSSDKPAQVNAPKASPEVALGEETQAGIEYPAGSETFETSGSESGILAKAGYFMGKTNKGTEQVAADIRELSKDLARQVGQAAREHPLAMGSVAVAVGAAMGLAVSEKRKNPPGRGEAPETTAEVGEEQVSYASEGIGEEIQSSLH
jgi:hypothetical protein